jgi:hypothetical protein
VLEAAAVAVQEEQDILNSKLCEIGLHARVEALWSSAQTKGGVPIREQAPR